MIRKVTNGLAVLMATAAVLAGASTALASPGTGAGAARTTAWRSKSLQRFWATILSRPDRST